MVPIRKIGITVCAPMLICDCRANIYFAICSAIYKPIPIFTLKGCIACAPRRIVLDISNNLSIVTLHTVVFADIASCNPISSPVAILTCSPASKENWRSRYVLELLYGVIILFIPLPLPSITRSKRNGCNDNKYKSKKDFKKTILFLSKC